MWIRNTSELASAEFLLRFVSYADVMLDTASERWQKHFAEFEVIDETQAKPWKGTLTRFDKLQQTQGSMAVGSTSPHNDPLALRKTGPIAESHQSLQSGAATFGLDCKIGWVLACQLYARLLVRLFMWLCQMLLHAGAKVVCCRRTHSTQYARMRAHVRDYFQENVRVAEAALRVMPTTTTAVTSASELREWLVNYDIDLDDFPHQLQVRKCIACVRPPILGTPHPRTHASCALPSSPYVHER